MNTKNNSKRAEDKKNSLEKTRLDRDMLKQIDIVAFNQCSEVAFVEMVKEMVANWEVVRVLDIVRETSFELDISPETAKRYLLKHSASRAEFQVIKGVVTAR